MNENELIIKAIQQPTAVKKKRKVMNDIEPDPDIVEHKNDAIWKAAKKQAKREKAFNKSVTGWSGMDFLRYIDKDLRIYDIKLERYGFNDANMISKLYDLFVSRLGKRMNNSVLKDYLEWWISCHASTMHGRKVSVYTFMKENYINTFLNRFTENNTNHLSSKKTKHVDDDQLYQFGGLSMLLINRGIVAARRLLLNKPIDKVDDQIFKALGNFSKEILSETIEATVDNAPYSRHDMFDFVLLVRPLIESFNLHKLDKLEYRDYFSV